MMEGTMLKLTDTQLVTLSRALMRSDGAVIIPESLKGAAAATFARRLIDQRLVRIAPATAGMPIWRRTEDDGGEALVITDVAYAALGVMTPPTPPSESELEDLKGWADEAHARPTERPRDAQRTPPARGKRDAVLALLRAHDGASMAQMERATGWQKHSIRAFLSGLRKAGQIVMRSQHDGVTVYRVTDQEVAATADDCPRVPVTAGEA
jgi:hypothetical protein